MPHELAIAAGTAAAVTVITEPLVIRWLARAIVLDIPNDRSSHSIPVPRGGGVALVLGTASGALLADRGAWPGIAVVGAFAALGLADDLTDVPAFRRLVAQIVLGAATGLMVASLTDSPRVAFAVVVCSLLLPSAVNAVNFMDGINGMTGLNAAASGVLFAVAAWHVGATSVAVLAIALAGGAVGFLPWNLGRARVFLGDVGSYAVGAGLGLCAVAVWLAGAGVLAAIGPLLLYFADTGSTLVRRAVRHEQLLEAHHSHSYQRLTDLGLGHTSVATFTALTSAAIGSLLVTASWSEGRVLPPLFAAGLLLAAYLTSPELLEVWRKRRSADL